MTWNGVYVSSPQYLTVIAKKCVTTVAWAGALKDLEVETSDRFENNCVRRVGDSPAEMLA